MKMRAWVGLAVSLSAAGLLALPQHAAALDCSAKPLDGKGVWVYRTVEGKKCWYRGTKVIPKAELRWPEAATEKVRNAQALLVPVALPASTNDERHPVVLDIVGDTFEARWRGLPR